MKPTVVWDVDDVLNDLTANWLAEVWAPAHPDRPVAFDDLDANPPTDILALGMAEYLASLDAFRASAAYEDQAPNARILAWLAEHGDRSHHVALTATAFRAAPQTAAWVLRHYGRWIRQFAFVPSTRPDDELPLYDVDKGEWIRRLAGAAVLVDDTIANLDAASAAGAAAICWPQPWNRWRAAAEDPLVQLAAWLDGYETG